MNFIVSRHAQRRMKLYSIDVTAIEKVIRAVNDTPGKHEIIEDLAGYAYPIKIVYAIESGNATLITAFPLKKRIRS